MVRSESATSAAQSATITLVSGSKLAISTSGRFGLAHEAGVTGGLPVHIVLPRWKTKGSPSRLIESTRMNL